MVVQLSQGALQTPKTALLQKKSHAGQIKKHDRAKTPVVHLGP
jgi:hypothetical protein